MSDQDSSGQADTVVHASMTDWDDAYANAEHIADADHWLETWPRRASSFRRALADASRAQTRLSYGDHDREVLDVYHPVGQALGVAIIVHGGYWLRFDAHTFSHLAAGAVERGWLVATPSYPLCPDARINDITRSVSKAIGHASGMAAGPIRLAGHSAGGHLVTRQLCPDSGLSPEVSARIERVLSISGLHDLRPLMHTTMNDRLRLDDETALGESAALQNPTSDAEVIAWVGAAERPEFLRQSALLCDAWNPLGVRTTVHVEPERHHFDVIEDLERADSPMLDLWLGG